VTSFADPMSATAIPRPPAAVTNRIRTVLDFLKILLAVFRAPTVCPGAPTSPVKDPADSMPRLFTRPCRSRRPGPARVSLGALLGLGLLVSPTLNAAETVRRSFDIPAGDAASALRQFAAQSGEQLLFSPDDVGGIETRTLRGEFAALGALEVMLARTPLQARQDELTKAISITPALPSRAPPSPPPADRPSKPAQPPAPNSSPSSSVKSRSLLSLLTGLVVAAPAADGQTAPPKPPVEEAITLSPFTVTTEKETGYAAANTLAGTRLNTPVKDLGAAISIYTKDFLDDIGATNANEFLVYATGMEAAGPGGNFSGAAGNIGADQVVGDAPRVNPQGATRTRGLSSPTFARGLYATDIASDSYNTETATVIRGPNSILFGVGSPAGVVDTTLLRPNLNRDRSKVETRVGDNSSLRGNVDFNRVLIRGKLALRLAALHDDDKPNQRPAFEEKRRFYTAVTYEPFKSTSLRANLETGRTRANRPITVLPFNNASSYWLAAGRPGFDWTFYDDPARNPAAATQNASNFVDPLMGQGNLGDAVALIYSQPDATRPDLVFRGTLPNSNVNAANSVRAATFQPLVNRDTAADAFQFLVTRNIAALPAAFWTGANVRPGQQPGIAPAGIKFQSFTDFSAFDFRNHMLDETSRQGESFRALNVAFEQRALRDHVGIEVALDRQRVDRRSKNSFFSSPNSSFVYIDTNAFLPIGQPNPNYGRPFALYGQSNWSNNYSERETARATAFARYDFKDAGRPWMRWLGRHTLTGLYEQNSVDILSYQTRLATAGEVPNLINPGIITFARRPAIAVYMGPSVIGNTNPLQLSAIKVPELVAGAITPVTYFKRAADATDPGAFTTGSASLVDINQGGFGQREVIKSQAVAFQSYWLKDHLVTLLGWRRDEDYYVRRTITGGSTYFDTPITDPANPGKVEYGFNDLPFSGTPPPSVSKEVKSFGSVLKLPNRLFRLPDSADLRLAYNQSENFTPLGGRTNSYLEPLPSPEGVTKEYGFSLSLFNGKFSVRYNHFENSTTGQSSTPTVYDQATRIYTIQLAGFWMTEANRNPENVPFMNAAVEKLFSALPADFRSQRNLAVTGVAPNLSSSFSNPGGGGDTIDYTAKGHEIELVYNPTSNWRILANVANQETVQNNSYPVLKEFLGRMIPIWNSTVTDPVSGRVVRFADIPRTGYSTGTGPVTGPAAAAELTGPAIERDVLIPYATALAQDGTASAEQRKWRVNFVTNYRFGPGSIFGERLRGWSIGGAVRWQDRLGIGYPTTRNPNGSVNIDLKNPYYAPAETNVDGTLGYTRKIFRNRIDWRLQLNVRNLISDQSLVPITVQPWGEVASARLAPERRWYLTNSFSF
jgi:outer membrane receptor protein involved in Fe transport